MDVLLGVVLVTVAGLGTGSIAWPMKLMKKLDFEHYWFVGMLAGLVVLPWCFALSAGPRAFDVYAEVGWKPILLSNLFAVGWGVANVLYGVCVVRIGAALTGAILTGLGVVVGVTLPMAFKGSGLFSGAPDLTSRVGLVILAGVAVMLAGVVLTSLAGFGREKALTARSGLAEGTQKADRTAAQGGFLGGLVMVVIAGVLSCGIALAFVYGGSPIVDGMKERGAGEVTANFAFWAIGLLGGAAVNLVYPAYLMTVKRSWGRLFSCPRDLALGAVIGVQFIIAIALLGRGMVVLGVLGASVGFGIQQAMQIMGNQAVGFVSGEWRGVTGPPRGLMYTALAVLIGAMVVLAYAKQLHVGP